MQNVELLLAALEYMEMHLGQDIKTEDVAKACYCSKSTLEKLFRCVNHITVHDYLVRRRMMMAARRLAEHPQESILSVALEYGYSTHESFARAFKSIWNCNPSEFRGTKYYELFPRLNVPLEEGSEYMSKCVDISQLYDLFVERKDCYFVLCDIKSLIPINAISHKAGDLAILESMNRMNHAAGEEDVVFRIGGDEFCILTSSTESSYAEKIAENIRMHNGETFDFNDKKIPLSLYVVSTKITGNRGKYNELFVELHEALQEIKKG